LAETVLKNQPQADPKTVIVIGGENQGPSDKTFYINDQKAIGLFPNFSGLFRTFSDFSDFFQTFFGLSRTFSGLFLKKYLDFFHWDGF
jgi:hypothetical protein